MLMKQNFYIRQWKHSQKIQYYAHNIKPLLNEEALFSDGSRFYRIPQEPTKEDDVIVRLRTAHNNVEQVVLIYKNQGKQHEVLTKKVCQKGQFDYYEGIIPKSEYPTEYYFEIKAGLAHCYYNSRGVMEQPIEYYNFRISPDYKTPDWAKGAVMYQIYVDRFCNGDETNDVETREYYYLGDYSAKVEDWDKFPAHMGVREFYGGDLQGILNKLDYLQELGVEVLYLNPIFVSPSNHKYDIQDYDYIDPHYGKIVKDEGQCLEEGKIENKEATRYICRVTDKENLEASNDFFLTFVQEVHKRGMRIILDGVFNHCGSFNKWLDREQIYEHQAGYEKGAYIDEKSPYQKFFRFFEETWPYNRSYDGWWGHETLPKLNYEASETLYQYILDVAKKWVSPPYCVDGWRLDVAADLGHSKEFNHQFWRDFRRVVKEANQDAIILAEHYGDAFDWLQGDQWDTVMNYDAFMEPITWFLTGMQKHSDEYREDLKNNFDSFYGAMTHHMSRFHYQSLEVAMNELSNHDHSRFLTRTNGRVGRVHYAGSEAANEGIKKEVLKEAVLIQMTWIGAPTLYYGDEVGVCGWTDPDNRRSFPWGKEDVELLEFHKKMIAIHKQSETLKIGSLKFLYGDYGILSYGRFTEDEQYVVVINNLEEEKEIEIPVWQLGVKNGETLVEVICTNGETEEKRTYITECGNVSIRLLGQSGVLLKKVERND